MIWSLLVGIKDYHQLSPVTDSQIRQEWRLLMRKMSRGHFIPTRIAAAARFLAWRHIELTTRARSDGDSTTDPAHTSLFFTGFFLRAGRMHRKYIGLGTETCSMQIHPSNLD